MRYWYSGYLYIAVIPFFIFGIAALLLAQFPFASFNNYIILALGTLILTLLIAIAATIIKSRALILEVIPTQFSPQETRQVFTEFSRHYRFQKENNRKNLIIVTTRLTKRTPYMRRERITMFITDTKVYVTSISDPDGSFYLRSLFNRSRNLDLIRSILSGTRNVKHK